MKQLAIGLMGLTLAAAVQAEMYRCTDAAGTVTFSQTRCAADAVSVGNDNQATAGSGTQCKGWDGAWHAYGSDLCDRPKPTPAYTYKSDLPPPPPIPKRPPPDPASGHPFDELRPRIEPGAIIRVSTRQISAMMIAVAGNGYRCDSVSAAMPFLMGGGHSLTCNNSRYSYDIEDRGGRLVVTVK